MNNFQKGLLGAIAVTSFLGFNPSLASAQLTPAEQRSAECLGYALGALISGDTSQLCGKEPYQSSEQYQYQNSNYYNEAAERKYRRQQEIENYRRDLKHMQLERRLQNATYGLDDGVCLSCSD